jgi:RNA polymerase sigma factor (sigma-70 family)
MEIDLDLITACIRRERKAEYELYKVTYSYLISICLRYTNSRDEAREMLNIGFLKILYNLEKYKPEVPFKKWIRKVMINTLIDEYRKEKKHHENIEYVENYSDTTNHAELNEALVKMDVDQIHSLIVKLPPVSRQVFTLYVIDGFNHKEIAEMLDITDGTSRWHLNFSRTKLKEMFLKLTANIKVA